MDGLLAFILVENLHCFGLRYNPILSPYCFFTEIWQCIWIWG